MTQALEVMTVSNVRGFIDGNGTVWLNAEDVTRGLGFVDYQEKISATCGRKTYEVIRWARVNGYLTEFGFSQNVGKDDFIPENMFYRLAMKASNAAAQAFQAKVADEILPAIRKHGVYATDSFLSRTIADPAWAIGVLTELKRQQDENKRMKAQLTEAEPKVEYFDSVLDSKELLTSETVAKRYGKSAHWLHETLTDLKVMYVRMRKGKKRYEPHLKYVREGYWQPVPTLLKDGDTITDYKWTQKGWYFVHKLLAAQKILPLGEQRGQASLFEGTV